MLKRVAIFAIPTALAKGVQFGSSALEFPNTGNDEFGDGIESVRTQVGVLWKDGTMPNDASPDFFVPRKLGGCGSTANKVNKGEQSPFLNKKAQIPDLIPKIVAKGADSVLDLQRVLDALKDCRERLSRWTPEDLLAQEMEMEKASRQVYLWESKKAEAEKMLKKLKADSASLRRSKKGRKGMEKRAISEALAKNQNRQRQEKADVSCCSREVKAWGKREAKYKSLYESKKKNIEETKECLQSISRCEERIHLERAKVLGDIYTSLYDDELQNTVLSLISRFVGADDRKLAGLN